MTAVAPEPRAPPSAHRRADGPAHGRAEARDGACSRPHSRHGEGGAEGLRSERYGGAPWSLSEVDEDSQRAGRGHDELRAAARVRQLEMLSEVSVVGQEFGWGPAGVRGSGAVGAAGATAHEGRVMSENDAAGVFGRDVCGSARRTRPDSSSSRGGAARSGRDSATELRRFMQSRAGDDNADSAESDGVEYGEFAGPRSPSILGDFSEGDDFPRKERRRRPLSATQGGVSSVAIEIRREIAASKARTKLHMK